MTDQTEYDTKSNEELIGYLLEAKEHLPEYKSAFDGICNAILKRMGGQMAGWVEIKEGEILGVVPQDKSRER